MQRATCDLDVVEKQLSPHFPNAVDAAVAVIPSLLDLGSEFVIALGPRAPLLRVAPLLLMLVVRRRGNLQLVCSIPADRLDPVLFQVLFDEVHSAWAKKAEACRKIRTGPLVEPCNGAAPIGASHAQECFHFPHG